MSTKKLLSAFGALFAAAMLFPAIAGAASAYLTITPHASSGVALQAGSGNYTEQTANRYSPAGTDSLCSVGIQLKKIGSPTGLYKVGLWQVTGSSSNPTSNTSELKTTSLDVTTLTTSYAEYNFDMTDTSGHCRLLTNGTDYYFRFTTTVAYDSGATNYVSSRDEDPANQFSTISRYTLSHNTGWASSTSEYPMILYGDSAPSVAIFFPLNTSVGLGGDFSNWILSYSAIAGASVGFQVDYATSSANLNSTSTLTGSDIVQLSTVPTSVVLNKQQIVPKNTGLTFGNYWARARLYAGVLQMATSTDIQFSITGDSYISNSSWVNPLQNPTSTFMTECDPSLSDITYGLCTVSVWLFAPDQTVLENFISLKDDIRNKPPFGYVTSISTALGSFTTSTTSTVDVTALDPLASAFSPIRAMVAWGLWLLYGFWIFNKFRHFKF